MKQYDPDEIPEEGLCLESLWPPSVSTSARCQLPAGHKGLHDVGDGSLMWGPKLSDPDETLEP